MPHEPSAKQVFEILVREHADMLTAFLRSLLLRTSSVDDVFQETRRPEPTGPYIADLCNDQGQPGADGFLTGADFDFFIGAFFAGCP